MLTFYEEATKMATQTVNFGVKRLDLHDTEISDFITVHVEEENKVADLTQEFRNKLQLSSPDLILRARNSKGYLIPLNGKICLCDDPDSRPFTLEVVSRFQSVQPIPNSLQLTEFAESLKNKILNIQDRLAAIEACMENMQERRQDKMEQEISKLENTVNFLKKRMEDAETIEWKGMFVKNPLW